MDLFVAGLGHPVDHRVELGLQRRDGVGDRGDALVEQRGGGDRAAEAGPQRLALADHLRIDVPDEGRHQVAAEPPDRREQLGRLVLLELGDQLGEVGVAVGQPGMVPGGLVDGGGHRRLHRGERSPRRGGSARQVRQRGVDDLPLLRAGRRVEAVVDHQDHAARALEADVEAGQRLDRPEGQRITNVGDEVDRVPLRGAHRVDHLGVPLEREVGTGHLAAEDHRLGVQRHRLEGCPVGVERGEAVRRLLERGAHPVDVGSDHRESSAAGRSRASSVPVGVSPEDCTFVARRTTDCHAVIAWGGWRGR